MLVNPFSWSPNVKSISVTATSGGVVLPAVGNAVLICNSGASDCFIRFGTGSATAVTTDFPVKSGAYLTFTINPDAHTYIAAICGGTDTTTLRIMQGEGV